MIKPAATAAEEAKMRHRTLVILLGLALAAARAHAAPPKAPPADVGSGRVAWFDLTTTNLSQARDFYGKLFDWTFAPVAGTDQALEIVSRGEPIGTIRGTEGAISAFNGVVYVQVADVQAACRRAADLGGKVAPGFPFNLTERTGAIGLVIDPSGHPIGLYSRAPLPR